MLMTSCLWGATTILVRKRITLLQPTEKSKKQRDNTNTPPKTSITQRLRTDLGLSVGVTTATQTGVIKPVYEILTFPLTANLCYQKDTRFKICK